jgi:amino acid transporter
MEAHSSSALVFAAHQLAGSPWDKFMAFAISLSVIGTTQAFLIGSARIAYAMGSDHVIPKVFGKIKQPFQTPAFGTLVFGVLTIVMTWLYVFSSSVSGAFDTVVTSVGVLFALFYAFTGFATSWYYRKLASRSLGDLVTVGILPSLGALVLLWIAVKSLADFSGSALWSMVGIGAAGIAMMLVSAFVWRAPFFRIPRVQYEPGAAEQGG